MKRVITLILLCSCVIAAKASETITPQDTIFRFKNKVIKINTIEDSLAVQVLRPSYETDSLLNLNTELQKSSVVYDGSNYNFAFSWKKRKKLRSHWAGFGMSFLNYDSDDIPNGKLKMSTSHNFSLNLIEVYTPIKNSNWLFVTGIGFDWFRYHFDTNAALTKKDGKTFFEPAPDGIDYASTKLLAYYITLPLLLEYQIPLKGNPFYISGGVVGFLKYYSKSQVKYFTEGERHVENKGRDLNIRPVDLKLRMQIGIGDVSAYAYYSPISMFDKSKGPDLKTYSIGVQLGF